MGWLISHSYEPRDTDEVMRSKFTRGEILASGVGKGTWYAAYRPEGEPYAMCLVSLIDRRGGFFGHKDMDETMGPTADDCPLSVFRKLSPLSHISGHVGYATSWRARVARKLGAASLQGDLLNV